jgi:hypothetical protein
MQKRVANARDGTECPRPCRRDPKLIGELFQVAPQVSEVTLGIVDLAQKPDDAFARAVESISVYRSIKNDRSEVSHLLDSLTPEDPHFFERS